MAVGETVFFKNFGPRVGEMVLVSLGRSHLCRGRKRPGEEAMVHTLRTLPALVLRGRLCPFLLSLSLGRGGVGQRRAGRGRAERLASFGSEVRVLDRCSVGGREWACSV